MDKIVIIFFASYLLVAITSGISCKSNKSKIEKSIYSVQQNLSTDTIIDPITLPGCEILLNQKSISISSQEDFPKKSTGNAIVNVIISKDGKLESWALIHLRIIKGETEIYIFDQTTRRENKYPNEIEFICNGLNKELHKAVITCNKDNNKETRLRIPVKIKLE